MLNLVMTHSPRLAAMATNKPLGEDLATRPALMHRLAWMRRTREQANPTVQPTTDTALREQHA